ncbi:MAG: 5-bromo-4-chloroindolyl phosphate hydrolysis family protein [Faecousia sp.]|nr:5-bromo-4-chloroindolyl phosphate hydrolysis family protein [Bacillota bacterium]
MKNRKTSGFSGILFLIGAVAFFLFLRHFFPALSTVFLVIAGIALLLVILLVVLVIVFSRQKPEEKERTKASADVNAILVKGRSNLMELRRLEMRVKDRRVRTLSEEICRSIDRILRTLKEQPEDIPAVRQFFNYYLPTLGSILLKYVRLEESGVPTAEITENTVSCLNDIRTAMEKQYANLFEDDMLDLSVEMEALTTACKRDGLLDDEGFKENGMKVNLTL